MNKITKFLFYTVVIFIIMNIGVLVNLENNNSKVIAVAVVKPVPAKTVDESDCNHSYKWVITKNATCTKVGSMSWKCSKCGDVETTTSIKALGHNYKFTSCVTQDKCTRCNATTGIPSGHPGYMPATCTSPAKCMRCGETSGKALGHNYAEATCIKAKKCTRCNNTLGKALGHDFKYIRIDSAWHIGNCTRCNYSKSMEKHIMNGTKCSLCGSEKIVINETKCTTSKFISNHKLNTEYESVSATKHVKILTCTQCNISQETVGEHVLSKATCVNPPKCSICKFTVGKALGHSHNIATCTSPAKCVRCGETSGKALGHNYAEATCIKAKKCTRCNNTLGKALGHDFKYIRIDSAWHIGNCTRCNYSKSMEKHIMNGTKCSLCGSEKSVISETKCTTSKFIPNHKLNTEYESVSTTKHVKILTCTQCNVSQEIESEHVLSKATCVNPPKCSICKKTVGKALGHNYNTATCTLPKKCLTCGLSFGELSEHKLVRTKIDKELHSVKCENCEYSLPNESHNYKNGECTGCGFELKCTESEILSGHSLIINRARYNKSKEFGAVAHVLEKYCIKCKVTLLFKENHEFNDDGKCIKCSFDDASKAKCTPVRFVKGHKVTIKEYKNLNLIHTEIYYCTTCGTDIIKPQNHKYVSGVCACGKDTDLKLCEHDENNWKIKYEKINGESSHWKVYKCNECQSETKIIESHVFNEKGMCVCNTKFVFSVTSNINNGNQMNLAPGDVGTLKIIHNGGKDIKFIYTSMNTEIATVDDNGNVTANLNATTNGTTKIKVTSPFGDSKQYSINLYLMESNMSLEAPNKAFVNQPIEIKATIESADKSLNINEIEKNIKWTVTGNKGNFSNVNGSTVIFTPTQIGEINIKASVKVGNTSLNRNVIIDVVNVESKEAEEKMTLLIGESIMLNEVDGLVKVSGESVEVSGNVFTAVNLGTTIFKDNNGKIYEVTVSNQLVYINKIIITLEDDALFIGDSTNIRIETFPKDATETYTLIIPDGLQNQNGTITALKNGVKTIKVKTKNIEEKAIITVNQEALKFKVNNMQVALDETAAKVLVDLSKLKDEKHSQIRYISQSPEIFEVKSDGTIIPKAKGRGKIVIEVDFQEYKNGNLTNKKQSASAYIQVIDEYTKINSNVFIKNGTSDSKEILIYIPGSSGLDTSDNADLKQHKELYYTHNNENEYKNDVIIYNKTQNDNSSKIMKESILERYGVSSVEEFNNNGYSLNIAGLSQGGAIAIDMAYELKDMGFNIKSLALLDTKISQNTGNRKSGEQQIKEMMQGSDINLITVSSGKINKTSNASKITNELGEELKTIYGERVNVVQTDNDILTSIDGIVVLDKLAGGIDALCSEEKLVNGHDRVIQKYKELDTEHVITLECRTCNITISKTERHKFKDSKCECGKINETLYIYANGDSSTKVKENDGGVVASNTEKINYEKIKANIELNEKIDFSVFSAGAKNLDVVVDAYTEVMQNSNEPKQMTIRLIEPGFTLCGGKNPDDISGLMTILEDIPEDLRQYVKIELVVGEKERENHKSIYNSTIKVYGELSKIQNDSETANFASVELYAVNQDSVSDGTNTYKCNNLEYTSKNHNPHEVAQEAMVKTYNIGTLNK